MHPKSKRVVILASVAILTIMPVVLMFGVTVAEATDNCFTDVSTGDWFHDFVCWMFDAGLTSGYPDGSFRPNNSITRAEVAVFMQQVAGAGSAGPVTNADMLDGLDSLDFHWVTDIEIAHNGQWSANFGLGNAEVRNYTDVTRMMSTGGTTLFAQLHLVSPNPIFDENYGLSQIEICYDVSSGDRINNTRIRDLSGTGNPLVLDDTTDRTSTTTTCYTVTPGSPIVPDGGLLLILDFAFDSAGDWLDLRNVTSTWTPASGALAPIQLGPGDPAGQSGGN